MNLIENSEKCVLNYLEAYSNFNEDVIQISNYPIIIRKDIESLKDQVVILSGGGGGHEPAHAGFVGKGMLSAAVSGGVFSSPPPTTILEGICQIGRTNNSGVLLIVKNYTGDRINFNIAAERAKKLGTKIEIVIVGDDTAVENDNKVCGRRGLAGTVLIHKIAGAMADKRFKLEEIKQFLTKILEPGNMGTIGISFTGTSLSKSTRSDSKQSAGMYELGLGIHGEAGVKREQFKNVDILVKEMIKYLAECGNGHVTLNKGDKFVVLVNNLGSCTDLELFYVANHFIKYLETEYCIIVSLGYCGNYVTSLQMYGISLTILKIIDECIIDYLESPCNAPGWNNLVYKFSNKRKSKNERKPILGMEKNSFASSLSYSKQEIVPDKDFQQLLKIINCVCETLINKEKYLNDLDAEIGDSDCGTTFKAGAIAVKTFFNEWNNENSVKYMSLILSNLSFVIENQMGGSSGGLLSLFFESLSRKYKEDPNSRWCDLFLESVHVMSNVGGAVEGDRTMLDILFPVCKMWQKFGHDSIISILPKLVEVAKNASKLTMKMKAKAGRASYVKESVMFEKHPDPGGEAISIIIEAINKSFIN